MERSNQVDSAFTWSEDTPNTSFERGKCIFDDLEIFSSYFSPNKNIFAHKWIHKTDLDSFWINGNITIIAICATRIDIDVSDTGHSLETSVDDRQSNSEMKGKAWHSITFHYNFYFTLGLY